MIALVTGASSGIGKNIAIELSKHNYDIILVARNKERLEETSKLIKTKTYIYQVDLSNKDEVIKLHNDIKNKFNNIDILVNNAGFGDYGYFGETSLDKDLSMINTNIVALHILTKLFLSDMVKVNHGKILNTASIAGFMAGPKMATYYSTKSYVVRFTESIRSELFFKHSKVQISALCPGPVNTSFNKNGNVKFRLFEEPPEYVAKYAVFKLLHFNTCLYFSNPFIFIYRLIVKILPEGCTAKINYFMQKKY